MSILGVLCLVEDSLRDFIKRLRRRKEFKFKGNLKLWRPLLIRISLSNMQSFLVWLELPLLREKNLVRSMISRSWLSQRIGRCLEWIWMIRSTIISQLSGDLWKIILSFIMIWGSRSWSVLRILQLLNMSLEFLSRKRLCIMFWMLSFMSRRQIS